MFCFSSPGPIPCETHSSNALFRDSSATMALTGGETLAGKSTPDLPYRCPYQSIKGAVKSTDRQEEVSPAPPEGAANGSTRR